MIKVIEYTNPGCVPCMLTKKKLDELKTVHPEIEIEYKNISENLEEVRKLGIMSAPHLIVTKDGTEVLNVHGSPAMVDQIECYL